MPACLHACMKVCMQPCMLACQLGCLHACLHAGFCRYAYLHTCMPACIHHDPCMPACMHTWMNACQPVCPPLPASSRSFVRLPIPRPSACPPARPPVLLSVRPSVRPPVRLSIIYMHLMFCILHVRINMAASCNWCIHSRPEVRLIAQPSLYIRTMRESTTLSDNTSREWTLSNLCLLYYKRKISFD